MSGNVSAVLRRSGRCPLSIHIDESDGQFVGHLPRFLSPILPECARWEYLKLRLSSFLDGPCIDGPMPLLQRVDFALDHTPEEPYVLLGAASLLRTAILDAYAAMNVMSTLPWAQLTSLTLTRMYMHECLPVLVQTSNPIVHCELELYDFGGTSPSEGFEVTLPSLESLTLLKGEGQTGVGSTYLETFVVPALCSLRIPESFLGPHPVDALASFTPRSGCSLAHVHIMDRKQNRYSRAHDASHFLRFRRESSPDSDAGD